MNNKACSLSTTWIPINLYRSGFSLAYIFLTNCDKKRTRQIGLLVEYSFIIVDILNLDSYWSDIIKNGGIFMRKKIIANEIVTWRLLIPQLL